MFARRRIVALAALVAAAVLALRVSADIPARTAPPPPPGTPQPTDQGDLELMLLLTVPFLALLLLAALRYPRRKEPYRPRESSGAPLTARQLLALAALIAFIAVLTLVARVLRPRITGSRPRDGSPEGSPTSTPAPSPGRRPDDGAPGGGGGVDFETLSAWVAGALLVLLVAVLLANRRRAPVAREEELEPEPPAAPSAPEVLANAAEAALHTVRSSEHTPRAAIIACYAVLEDTLNTAVSAAPQPADTPTEVLRRAQAAGLVQAGHGERLLALFTEARYSTHPMSEADRTAATDALRHILDDLRRPAWTPS